VAHALVRAVFALLRTQVEKRCGRSNECERGTHECVRHIGLKREISQVPERSTNQRARNHVAEKVHAQQDTGRRDTERTEE
jgi:hypothetical protein